jgi:hypothetical protein
MGGSVRHLLRALAARLNAAGDWRNANPTVLLQPQQQWPAVAPTAQGQAQVFGGYARPDRTRTSPSSS